MSRRVKRWLILGAVLALAMGGVAWANNEYPRKSDGVTWGGIVLMYLNGAGQSVEYSALPSLHSNSSEATHTFLSSGGSLFSVLATSISGGTVGWLLVFDVTSLPADGALATAPPVCVPIGNGMAQYHPGMVPVQFQTAIIGVLSSAPDCFHKTTGVLTGYFQAQAQ